MDHNIGALFLKSLKLNLVDPVLCQEELEKIHIKFSLEKIKYLQGLS